MFLFCWDSSWNSYSPSWPTTNPSYDSLTKLVAIHTLSLVIISVIWVIITGLSQILLIKGMTSLILVSAMIVGGILRLTSWIILRLACWIAMQLVTFFPNKTQSSLKVTERSSSRHSVGRRVVCLEVSSTSGWTLWTRNEWTTFSKHLVVRLKLSLLFFLYQQSKSMCHRGQMIHHQNTSPNSGINYIKTHEEIN